MSRRPVHRIVLYMPAGDSARLSRNDDPLVRLCVARTTNLPAHVARTLGADRDPAVRAAAVAYNPQHFSETYVLAQLPDQIDGAYAYTLLAHAADHQLRLLQKAVAGYTGHAHHVAANLATRKTVPPALLDWVAGQAATDRRMLNVAGHLAARPIPCDWEPPAPLLWLLLRDTDPHMQFLGTRCPAATDTMLAAVVPVSYDVAGQVDFTRKTRLEAFVETLTGDTRTHADLLLPTFSGWPADLAGLLQDLDG